MNMGINTASGRVLVQHSDLETLLHEFGHALHSLLSRTTFQHLSGTRAAADFIETPSQVWIGLDWRHCGSLCSVRITKHQPLTANHWPLPTTGH